MEGELGSTPNPILDDVIDRRKEEVATSEKSLGRRRVKEGQRERDEGLRH